MRWFHPESRQKTSFIKAAVMIYFRSIFLLPLVIVGVSSQTSIPPITLVVNANGKLHCVISNDTSNSAIAFIEDGTRDKIVTEHNPNANICMVNEGGDPFGCLEDNAFIKNYNRAVATQGFVLDRRWESFRTIKTQKDAYTFSEAVEIPDSNFNITISTRVKDGHILLCNSDPPNESHCYWFIIDGWGGSQTAMRRCENDIPTQPKIYPQTCDIVKKNITNVTSLSTWSPLRIEMVGNNISLYKFGERNPIINYTDSDPIPVRYMTFRSPNYDGFWKVHQYNFVEVADDRTITTKRLNLPKNSPSVCVAVYLNLCPNCKADITLLDSKLNSLDTKAVGQEGNIKEDNWSEIQLITNQHLPSDSITLQIRVSQTYGQKWYFGDILECNRYDIRKITTNSNKELCCQIMNSEWKICRKDITSKVPTSTSATSSSCPPNTIGKYCLPCTLFGSCENYKYCDFETDSIVQCHCTTRGYKGSSCDQKCNNKTYGDACEENCDRCLKECSHDDGQCIGGCMPNLEGDFCELYINPVLKSKPEVENVGDTNVTLKLNNQYNGKVPPVAYIVQLKEEKGGWKDAAQESFSNTNKSVIINDLKQETLYYVRILFRTMDGYVYSDDMYIPTTTFETKCTELSRKNLKVIVKGQTLSVKIKDSVNTCKIENYNYDRGSYKLHITNEIKDLEKCVENNIKIIKLRSTYSFNFSVKSGDNNGEDIQCLNVKQTQNSAILKWDYHGDHVAYQIQYRKSNPQKINCIHGNHNGSTTYSTVERNVSLNDLLPYTCYIVRITPTPKDGSPGKFKDIRFETKALDALAEESIIMNYTSNNRILNVTTLVEHCTKISGPIDFSLELKCESNWCLTNDTQIYNESDFLFYKHFPFLIKGFTNYTLLATIKRNNSEKKFTMDFTTNGTSPGPVLDPVIYSKTNHSMSLRWKPPYPPMGKLKTYRINHERISYYLYCSPYECPLYSGYHCCPISDLLYNKEYSLKICAINEEVNNCGTDTYLKGKTGEAKPYPPAYIQLEWKTHQNMTVKFPQPNITNGPLKSYSILMDSTSYVHENVFQERPTYTHEILNREPGKVIKVRVSVRNSADTSDYIEKVTISPPPTPKLLNTGSTNLTIVIPKFDLKDDVTFSLLVFVIDKKSKHGPTDTEKKNFKMFNIDNHGHQGWLAIDTILKSTDARQWEIVIGTDQTTEPVYTKAHLRDHILNSDTEHDIIIISIIASGNISTTTSYTISAQTTFSSYKESTNSYLYLLILIVPVICIMVFIILRQKGIKITIPTQFAFRNTEEPSNHSIVPLNIVPPQPPLQHKTIKNDPANDPTIYQNIFEALEEDGQFSRMVKVSELEKYIKNSLENNEFDRQHALFPRGQTKPWVCGTKPENKKKNRYINLAAYDHTRVKLEMIDDDPNSDYINANYIDGYNHPKAFIATQGPKESTLNEFWRMIWQENVEHVVMIANLVEGGKKKVAKYWPDINETIQFGDISVKYMSVDTFAEYEERIFSVSRSGHPSRKIKQLHFVSWPDHGVPLYPQSLVPFHKRILAIEPSNRPVVVHCSAGVGRTGTLILCDICLRMAAREGQMDILYHQFKLREQRPNMVDNVEQYKLVHMVLLQCLVAPDTSIICTDSMMLTVDNLLASDQIGKQMRYLDESAWQDDAMKMNTSRQTTVNMPEKNRLRNILPDDSSRVILSPYPISDESTTYINAIRVSGFQALSKYIVTQYPLHNTVGDFWRMIHQLDVTVVVCLNTINKKDPKLPTFYPTESCPDITPVPYLQVQLVSVEEGTHLDKLTFDLVEIKKDQRTTRVTLLQLNGWNYKNTLPDSAEGMLNLYEETNRIGKSCEEILVCCYDGVRASGVFTAMSFIIDKIKLEQLCDVCLAVRSVRHSRKEFVREIDQFKYLYKCALEYVLKFELYSNFRS